MQEELDRVNGALEHAQQALKASEQEVRTLPIRAWPQPPWRPPLGRLPSFVPHRPTRGRGGAHRCGRVPQVSALMLSIEKQTEASLSAAEQSYSVVTSAD